MQCGLEKPSCSRCVKAGIQCSGPLDTGVFIHLNARVMHTRTNRRALHEAYATRTYHNSTAHGLARQERFEWCHALLDPTLQGFGLSSTSSRLLNTVPVRTLYASITAEFTPRLKVGIFSGDRLYQREPMYSSVATCIRALLPHVSHHNDLLDLGLFSLLTRYVGAFRGDQRLVRLAMSSYTSVIGSLRQDLHRMEHLLHSKPHSGYASWVLLCLCLSLLLFEVRFNILSVFVIVISNVHQLIDEPAPKSTYETHVDGALQVLQTTGPAVFHQSRYLQHSLSGLRGLAVSFYASSNSLTQMTNCMIRFLQSLDDVDIHSWLISSG